MSLKVYLLQSKSTVIDGPDSFWPHSVNFIPSTDLVRKHHHVRHLFHAVYGTFDLSLRLPNFFKFLAKFRYLIVLHRCQFLLHFHQFWGHDRTTFERIVFLPETHDLIRKFDSLLFFFSQLLLVSHQLEEFLPRQSASAIFRRSGWRSGLPPRTRRLLMRCTRNIGRGPEWLVWVLCWIEWIRRRHWRKLRCGEEVRRRVHCYVYDALIFRGYLEHLVYDVRDVDRGNRGVLVEKIIEHCRDLLVMFFLVKMIDHPIHLSFRGFLR